jgi:hypothetical protein
MQKDESDLAVRPKNFVLQIISSFPKLPRTTEAQALGKQLIARLSPFLLVNFYFLL